MKEIIVLFISGCLAAGALGQGTAAPQARPDTAMLHFFTGHWTGKGQFANGRAIEADAVFTVGLDSCWIIYEHRDRAPNVYKATSFWPVDRSVPFAGFTFDNFHGHRQWMSNGWTEGKLVLSGSEGVGAGVLLEHFIYQRLSPEQFKMTYEVSRDGIVWVLGDWLVFSRAEE